MALNHHRLGAGIAIVGLVMLLTLRLWASPVARTITGRARVSLVTFLGIPVILGLIGAGIVIFLWGERLGFA